MGCECASYVGRACRDHVPSRCDGALEVWAGARSRGHHTFAGITAGLSSVRRTHGPRGSPGSEGVRQAPRRSEEILRRGMVALHIAALVRPTRRRAAPGGRGLKRCASVELVETTLGG